MSIENAPSVYFPYCLINGELIEWTGESQIVKSPITIDNKEIKLGAIPFVSSEVAMQALAAAETAYNNGMGEWPSMPTNKRIQVMLAFLDDMKTKRDEVVNLLMWEIAKPKPDAEKEFDRTIDYMRDTIRTLRTMENQSCKAHTSGGVMAYVKWSPIGVVLCMGPFNYPLNETFTTLLPALLMGNTILFKPPKFGVLLHTPLVELFRKHFPPGAVNIIFGSGRTTSTPILESGKVKGLAFIGQSKAAAELKKYHPKPHQFSTLLGLEAKNPAIVLEGTDINEILPEIIAGAFSFNGQRCTALKIIFVHRSAQDEFLSKLSTAADNLKIGLPWDEKVQITALPEEGKVDYLKNIITDALANGAKIINKNGGKTDGKIFYPTILSPVNETMKIYHEEQFGPVVPVVIFDGVQEVIDFLVHSHYGQQASIFGNNPEEIGDLINQIGNLVGRININSQCQRGPDYLPFTGRKDSAQGTVSLSDALEAFSLRVILAGKDTEANTELINNTAPYTSILEACSLTPASEF